MITKLTRWIVLVAVGVVTVLYLASGLNQHATVSSVGDLIANPVTRSSRTLDVDESRDAVLSHAVASRTARANIVAELDEEFSRHWEREGLTPAMPADWLAVCRRLSLALVGSGLSLEEIRALEKLPVEERIASHRENLLNDKRFADYWAERLARAVVGADEGPFLVYRRRRFTTWFSEQITNQTPYNELVRQLVTARGFFTDRPAVNFKTVTMDSGEGQPDPIRLAGRTSRAFLGMRIDCLQCHDDFLGNVELGSPSDSRSGTQQDFHQLAAFYSNTRFAPFQGIRNEAHPYEYTYLRDTEKTVVEPQVPFAPELLPTEGEPTERLAEWISHPLNRQASRAIANRVWALMFGQPLHWPVDDIPLHGPLPPGLDRLADGVVELNWDLRQMIRVISETRVFQLDSRAEFEVTEAHEKAWAVFPLVRLRPEQVARGVLQASRLTTIDDSAAFVMQLLAFGSENDFVKRYGDTGEDEFDQENVTITQRLLMMNGEMVRERTEHNPVLNASAHISMFATSDENAIDSVYLAVLNRYPTDKERTHFVQRAKEAEGRQAAVEDVYWVLLNGSEMAWNH